ncbi:MAG: amino acid aminotransferase [Chloroflexi bacterium]|nr:amino acid aminotransferase [Chloroflexota bacterium]
MSEAVFFINGAFVPASAATVPVTDLGFVRGWAVFETIRTYNGKLFRLTEHLARLWRSAELVHIPYSWKHQELATLIVDTLDRNCFVESVVKVLLTAGNSGTDFSFRAYEPALYITVKPLVSFPAELYEQGIGLITFPHERFMPEAKTTNYLDAVIATNQAEQAGAWEALYVDRNGLVRECTTCNFFGVRNGSLITPCDGILKGITRAEVLELARDMGITVDETNFSAANLDEFDEAFITATLVEIMPVTIIAGHPVGTGRVGPVTRLLLDAFLQRTRL